MIGLGTNIDPDHSILYFSYLGNSKDASEGCRDPAVPSYLLQYGIHSDKTRPKDSEVSTHS
jgi:hypothetical protein